MKKMLFKGLIVAGLATGGVVATTTNLYSQSESSLVWNPRVIDNGYWSNGVWVHVSWIICCGSGFTSCSPSGC